MYAPLNQPPLTQLPLITPFKVAARCNSLDYAGIIGKPSRACLKRFCDSSPVLILGSFYPCLYYGFLCEPRYKLCYSLLITAAGLGE